ncbi:hypothetical protein DXG01_006385 [Tephrocybe rancida]|nr:hypothetical protein DXG01_006385 [Tephrocybe rancida]
MPPKNSRKRNTAIGETTGRKRRAPAASSPPPAYRRRVNDANPARNRKKRPRASPSPPPPDIHPSGDIPPSVRDTTPATAQSAREGILDFFAFKYKTLKRGEGHTTSDNTRSPGTFDRHLVHEYRLKRVAKLGTIPEDLASVAKQALDNFTNLPPDDATNFPSQTKLDEWRRNCPIDKVQTESDIERIYGGSVAKACLTVAETLAYRTSSWPSSGCLRWSFRPTTNKKSPGAAKNQAVADGFLNLFNTPSLSDDQQMVFNHFTELAVWEFKNLNFGITAPGIATMEGIVGESFLNGLFPWETCKFKGQCVALHPQNTNARSVMGWDTQNSSCASYRKAIDSEEYNALLKARIDEAAKNAVKKTTRMEEVYNSEILTSEPKEIGDMEAGLSAPSRVVADVLNAAVPDTEPKAETEELDQEISDFNKSSRDLIQQVFTHREFLKMYLLIMNGQAWSEAVRHDATFIVIHAGNTEIICVRNRLTQTLYVSDIINIEDCENYLQIHTGLIIAAVRDAEDRARLLNALPRPKTWKYSSVDQDKILDFKMKRPMEARKGLLQAAKERTWLRFQAAADLSYLPFTKDMYHRLTEQSLHVLDMPRAREVSLAPSGTTVATSRETSPMPASQTLMGSASVSQAPPEDFDSQDDGLPFPLSQVVVEPRHYSLEDHHQETPLDFNTFYQLYVTREPFYGQRICRGTLKIHGTLFASDFRVADHPVLVIKNASEPEDMVSLRDEYILLSKLNKASISGIPQVYGLFYHPNETSPSQVFAALVLEDMGTSLSQILEQVKAVEREIQARRPQKRLKTKLVRVATGEQRIQFKHILDQLHNAGFAHGNLSANSLMFENGVNTTPTGVSIVGFKWAMPLEPSTREVVIGKEKRVLHSLLEKRIPEQFHKSRLGLSDGN